MQNDQLKSELRAGKYSFVVTIGTTEIFFQEVTGLNNETEVIEQRSGNSKFNPSIKVQGLKKHGTVTLKRGIVKQGKTFETLKSEMMTKDIARTTLTISLLDEAQKVSMSWTLHNAFPAKVVASDLNAKGNEVAIESIELEHEGLQVCTP